MRNCLTYAWRQYRTRGGYLVMRKSRFASDIGAGKYSPAHLVPHFLHLGKDGRLTQYVPCERTRAYMQTRHPLGHWLRLWHFDGIILEGDD